MFCPKCSQLQSSDNVCFCSRCGFDLEQVKALIESADRNKTKSQSGEPFIRQKDISIGAGLMFAGGIVAVIWGFVISAGPADVVLPQAFFILGFALAFVLLFFHPLAGMLDKLFSDDGKQPEQPLRERNGINLGAILMFIGTLKAMLITIFVQPDDRAWMTLLIMTGGFIILLIGVWLVRNIYRFLFQGEASRIDVISPEPASDITTRLQDSSPQVALPPVQSIPVEGYIPPRSKTRETVDPPSVTDETTKSLDRS
jgi:hypothetical protein